MNTTTNPIATVVQQHADVAAVLWLRRDRAVAEPHFTLADLAKLDGQLEAHVDGLRVAGDFGWRAAAEELRWKEPGELFSAGVLAWESGDESHVWTVIQAAGESFECSRALVSSLGWLETPVAAACIEQLLGSSSELEHRVGIAACAVHRRDPGDALPKVLASRDAMLKARALRAIGELGRQDLLPAAQDGLRSRDERVRSSAAWTLVRLTNERPAIEVLQEAIELQTPDQYRALQIVLRRMEPAEATRWLSRLAQDSRTARQAVIGAGIVGTPDAVAWLLEIMRTQALARVAAEAFTMITGVDLAGRLEGRCPPGFTAGPTEDPADDDVEMDPDENLSWPDVARLAAWWTKHSGDFAFGTRYLCGRPLNGHWLECVLRDGFQRQREAAALELALRWPDQPLFNVRAPGRRQQESLGLCSQAVEA